MNTCTLPPIAIFIITAMEHHNYTITKIFHRHRKLHKTIKYQEEYIHLHVNIGEEQLVVTAINDRWLI